MKENKAQTTRKQHQLRMYVKKIVGYSSSITGPGLIIYFIQQGDFKQAIFAGAIACCIAIFAVTRKVTSKAIEVILKTIESKLEEALKKAAGNFSDWLIANIESQIIWLWWKVTSNFRITYYRYLINTYRIYKPVGKIRGAIIPELDKVFITPKVIPVAPNFAKIYPIPLENRESSGFEIWQCLAGTTDQSSGYNRMLILGAPGYGKTTLLEELTLTYAQNQQHKKHPNAPKQLIPILISLTEVAGIIYAKGNIRLSKLISEKLNKSTSMNVKHKWFEDKLTHGQCLVMLDGLDEVQEDRKQAMSQTSTRHLSYLAGIGKWIDEQMLNYPKSIFIITSRPFIYRKIQLKKTRLSLRIHPFDLHQAEEFIYKWYVQNEIVKHGEVIENSGIRQLAESKKDDLISRIKSFPALRRMALNPMLLTMITILHAEAPKGKLPGSRAKLYDEICDVLFSRRDDDGRLTNTSIDQKQSKRVLQTLALALITSGKIDFSLEYADKSIQKTLDLISVQPLTTKDFLENIVNHVGLIIEVDKDLYRFSHLSFQEYLAALQIKDNNAENILIANISDSKWKEVIRLYIANSNGDKIIRTAMKTAIHTFREATTKKDGIKEGEAIELFTLAFACLHECNRVSENTRRRMNSWLETGLNSSNMQLRDLTQKIHVNMLYGSNN